jgi:teichoic acid transport system ATP-binding protein
MNKDIAIKVENLSKVYKLYNTPIDRLKESLNPFKKKYHKDFHALSDVSFEIKKGETVGIIGKNGSGKSTLLKIITGVLTPSSGKVIVNGRISALLELGSGFNYEYTGMENIYFQGNLLGIERKEMETKVQEILDFADIGDFIHQPVKNYSSGMFARLAFAVAINVKPDILIVDETLAVGDMLFQQKCLHKMKKMMQSGATILFVSHALPQVRSLCEQAVYLKQGEMVAAGASPEICDLYMNDLTSDNKADKQLAQSITKEFTNKGFNNNEKSLFYYDEKFNSVISERSGGQEIEFVSMKFYDSKNHPISEIYAGQSVKIVSSFIVNEDIPEGSTIGVHVTDHLGNSLLALNSNFYDFYLPEMKKGERRCLEYNLVIPFTNLDLVFSLGCKPDPFGNYFYDRVFGCGHLKCISTLDMQQKNIGGILYINDLSIGLS